MAADPYAVLRRGSDGENGSFPIRLRCDLTGDETAFKRLTRAILQAAAEWESRNDLPKWLAQGFWYIETFTRDWIARPSFPQTEGRDYAEGCEKLSCLSAYLFNGCPPMEKGTLEAWIGGRT